MKTIEIKLHELVTQFRKWLENNYTKEEIEDLRTDDPGYPEWDEIENYFSELLEKDQISTLSTEAQKNLLYLIARNWDLGHMLGWLYVDEPLSQIGNLKQADFIMLAKTLSTLDHPEFNDAKCQFVSSFRKFPELTPEIETLLLRFYNDKDEYTKRSALTALGKLGYKDIRNLIALSWNTIDNEHHKMGCLSVIDFYVKDAELMKHYLSKAELIKGKYIEDYVEMLRRNVEYR